MNSAGEPTPERVPISFAVGEADVDSVVAKAMAAARPAQARWSRTPLARRLELVRELRRLIAEHGLELAHASASARCRPALESLTAEVLPLAEACRFLEHQAAQLLSPRRLGKRTRPLWLAGVRSEIRREPLGVILIIGPGNYPLLLPGVQLVQALVAGNAVLLKPGAGGLPAGRALCELVVRAGFDPALVALLPESTEAACAAIAAGPDKVLFTGSAATGEKVLTQLTPHLIPATLELSGCDAVLVRSDADLDLTVKALSFGLALNDGATCMAPKRVFVSAACATELEGRLARRWGGNHASSIPAPRTIELNAADLIPGAHRNCSRLLPLLDEALATGAHFIAGGESGDGTFHFPVILGGVSPSSRLLREDLFAPVLAFVTVADDHEAVQRANNCPFALTASIFSRDEAAARLIADRISAGVVTINDLIIPTADARVPFGGRGRSGFGVTRGAEGLLELTRPKVVTLSRGTFRPAFEGPQPGDEQMFHSYLRLTHGQGLRSRGHALISLLRTILRRKTSSPLNQS